MATKAKTTQAAMAAYAAAREMATDGEWKHRQNALLIAKRAKHHFPAATSEQLLAFHAELHESSLGGNARLFGLEAGVLKESAAAAQQDVAAALGLD